MGAIKNVGIESDVPLLAIGKILTLPLTKMPSPEAASTSKSPSPAPEAEKKGDVTFKSLGLIDPLLDALNTMNFKTPTEIQQESLPHALEGRDIIGVAATGSGKTAAFALPILQKLWDEPKGLFACVLAPTRELAYQISQQFEALGASMGARCAVIVGGMDMPTQAIALAKRPHVVVATPGRLLQHLEETKGFSLRTLKFLVRIDFLFTFLITDRVLRFSMKPIVCSTWTSAPLSTKSSSLYRENERHISSPRP